MKDNQHIKNNIKILLYLLIVIALLLFSTRYCTVHNKQQINKEEDNEYHSLKKPKILATPTRQTTRSSNVKNSNALKLVSDKNSETADSNTAKNSNTLPLQSTENRKVIRSNIKEHSNIPILKSNAKRKTTPSGTAKKTNASTLKSTAKRKATLPSVAKNPNSLILKNTVNNKQSGKETPIFRVSKQPPPGFRSLSAPQSVMVDVYYQGQFVGVAKATTTPNWLRFSHPQRVTNFLRASLVDEAIVQKALTGKLATHTGSLCEQNNSKNCDVLLPKVASILYAPNAFRAHVFVNSKFKKEPTNKGLQRLPSSTSGFSYINQLYAVSSNISGKDGYHDYSLYSNNTWAYKNMRFNLNGSYVSDLTGTTVFQANTANFSMTQKQYQYRFGILDTTGNEFFPDRNILGAEFATTLKTLPAAASGVTTPINISLNFPSQVDVYKEDKLIYTGHYPAGNQSVDTSTFPTGSYPIKIRITNGQGITQELSSYVVKSTVLAPPHIPQYYAIAGYLMGSRQNNAQTFSKPLPIPIYEAGSSIRLSPHWGTNFDLLATQKHLFSKIGLIYLQQHWSMRPAFFLGDSGAVGYSGSLNYYHKRFSLYANVLKIWHRVQSDTNVNTANNPADNFLRLPTLEFNMSANYGFNKSNISLFARLSRPNHGEKTYAYSPSFRTELFRKGNTTFNLDVSATQSDHDRSVLARITVSFGASPLYGYGSLTTDDLAANGHISWHHFAANNTWYGLTANAATEANTNDMGVNYNYRNNRLRLSTSGQYTHVNGGDDLWQYGGSLSTHFIYTPSSLALSGGNRFSDNTGVLVQVKSQQPNGVFDVYSNDYLVKQVKSNQPVFVSLEPFNQYRISVVNQSSALYHFATAEKRVVIYPGNVQKVTWNAIRKYIVIGRLLTPEHRPIKDAIIHGGVGYNATDDNGYFQLETYTNVTQFNVTNHHNCRFTIPQFQAYNIFHYLDSVVCYPTKKENAQN